MCLRQKLTHSTVKSRYHAGGRIGNYVFGGERKASLLESEGVRIVDGKVQDFEQIRFRFLMPAESLSVK